MIHSRLAAMAIAAMVTVSCLVQTTLGASAQGAGGEAAAVAMPTLVYPAAAPAVGAVPAPEAPAPAVKPALKPTPENICALIAKNAEATGMSPDFFARLIWKESRFDIGAVSPVGAQGIAQFMPYTADERGLDDPFHFVEAIRHSALYLRDLKVELGNWGLAAAAYNGGINRVKRWRANGGSLPAETEEYVYAITFRPADWFRQDGRELEERPLDKELDFDESCKKLPIMKTRSVFASLGGRGGPASAPMLPWGVQVAGHAQEAVAMKMFRRMQGTYPAVLGGVEPIVMRTRPISGPRLITAVRVGAETREKANALCGRLKSAGGSCVVMKN